MLIKFEFNNRYLIYDPKTKFGLIWSYILKVMNFLIFRDFSRIFLEFFLNFYGFIFIEKRKEISF